MKFTPNKPVRFSTPTVTVDAGSLPAGRHRFQLIVENARGQKSQPVEVIVEVVDDVVILRRVEPRAPLLRPSRRATTPEPPTPPERPTTPERPARRRSPAKGSSRPKKRGPS